MADPDFETLLGRWFSETPTFADADLFAMRIKDRLNRSGTARRLLIGAAGLTGGVVAAGQVLGVDLLHRLTDLSGASARTVSQGAKTLGQLHYLVDLPAGGEVMWMIAGLAVLAVLLVATRSLEEF